MICLPLTPLPAPSWHGWPKQRTGARLSPNTRYRLSSHPNEKRPSHYGRGAQSDDKAYNRKNCPDKKKIRWQFLLPAGGFAEPFGIVKSSRKVASPRACKSPMATVFDDQRSAKTPRRQILPQAKFPRQLHLHPAVTYVHVSSLGCKYCFLGVDLPSPSGSSNPVAFGDKFCRWQNFRALTKPTTAKIALIK